MPLLPELMSDRGSSGVIEIVMYNVHNRALSSAF
jgi:hypothetical protein